MGSAIIYRAFKMSMRMQFGAWMPLSSALISARVIQFAEQVEQYSQTLHFS